MYARHARSKGVLLVATRSQLEYAHPSPVVARISVFALVSAQFFPSVEYCRRRPPADAVPMLMSLYQMLNR